MASTKFSLQSILLLCLIFFSLLALHQCDEGTSVKPEIKFDGCMQIPGKGGQYCCVISHPQQCYPTIDECEAKCKR
ncbi:hypothetical protein EJD97_001494 [Solanum chilense]|uniref:Uncharacterized protein n=1 Tax=Solanum chilense TaxID=4083 RepID=A0A6N2AQR1_SOLCI|nr:hypothetical protein EJD97_001494 [Solanum chilense]